MIELKINANQISSIKIYIKHESRRYEYKSAKKNLFVNRKEGFYHIVLGDYDYLTMDDIKKSKQFYVENNKLYYYPHIEVRMSNNNYFEQYFKTEEELQTFLNLPELKNIPLINIE